MRLGWYVGCLAISLCAFYVIAVLNPVWPVKLVCGVLMGLCHGTLGFIAHEVSHGSVVKGRRAQYWLTYFATIPLFIAPTYWKYSHDRTHHGKTQKLIEDPDAFPTLRIFKSSRFMRFMYPFTPGSGYKRSWLYFFFWFQFHNVVAQVYMRYRNRVFDAMDHTRVTIELIGQVLIVSAFLAFAGPSNWVWVALIPLALQNYLLMSYIATNHNLSPLTPENDPLVNSLTVTNHPVLEFLNLNFGYHVEHHIYPTVNGKHIKAVYHALKKEFPQEFKTMPKGEAMRALYKTARIYKTSTQLVNPVTGATYPTI